MKFARVSRLGKVASGMSEVALRTCGAGKKVSSHGLANLARLQEAGARWLHELAVQESKLARVSRSGKVARSTGETWKGCKRHERRRSANLRCKKVISHGLADPARLQEARVRWLGELAAQEMNFARVSRPGKVARGTSDVARRTCGARKHERRRSANLRCKKVISHGLADPARLQEARVRWLGELAAQEMNFARVSRPGKVARGTSDVARRTCGARK
ncbi:hypothetical protein CRG98_041072 [Punica granatum]|uniref:Uncharacterized protein n=1 Tax=Punica granatum TaxID=22663 RepID=A0A2I0I3M3_PUNGR|nr:hypothetical protein CRG98_041072 [Punica granatum]